MAGDTPKEPGEGDGPQRPKPPWDQTRAVDLVALEVARPYGPRPGQPAEVTRLPNRPDNHQSTARREATDETRPQSPTERDRPPSGDPSTDRVNQWAHGEGDAERPDPAELHIGEARKTHILIGEPDKRSGGHRHGSGIPGKTTFPPEWDDQKILAAIMDVAKNPDRPPVYQEDHRTWLAAGVREDVQISVSIKPDGSVHTAFPPEGKGVHRNDKNGNPIPLPWPPEE